MSDMSKEDAWSELCARLDRNLNRPGCLAILPDGNLDRSELQALLMRTSLNCGTRVLVLSRSDRVVISVLAACLKHRACLIVGDPSAPTSELAVLCTHCDPGLVVADFDVISRIPAGIVAVDKIVPAPLFISSGIVAKSDEGEGSAAIMVFTSGTTQRSKLVELGPEALVAQLGIFADVYGFDANTRHVNLLPLHHVDGLMRGPLAALWYGSLLLRRQHFSYPALPSILDSIAEDRATHFSTVPTMLRMMERFSGSHAHTFLGPDFRMIICGADVLDEGLWRRTEETFRTIVVNVYGLSEVVCDALFAGPDDYSRVRGTIGMPQGIRASIIDDNGAEIEDEGVGELVLSGPTLMRGYFRSATTTEGVLRDGIFRTGDLVRRSNSGLFQLVGRKKSVVIVGGVTIYPEGITEVLLTHPDVAEAYTSGVGSLGSEELVAAVVLKSGGRADEVVLMGYLRQWLSPERMPARILLLAELPRGASGKVISDALAISDSREDLLDDPTTEVISLAARCFKQQTNRLSPSSTPFNTDGWDSLSHVALIFAVESRYRFVFSPVEIARILSLSDIIGIVESHLQKLGRTQQERDLKAWQA